MGRGLLADYAIQGGGKEFKKYHKKIKASPYTAKTKLRNVYGLKA